VQRGTPKKDSEVRSIASLSDAQGGNVMKLKKEDISGEPWEWNFMPLIEAKGEVIGAYSDGDWSGMAVVAWKGKDGAYNLTEWNWGTCEYCDPYCGRDVNWEEELDEITRRFSSLEDLITAVKFDFSLVELLEE
jgi:hypothetical protein